MPILLFWMNLFKIWYFVRLVFRHIRCLKSKKVALHQSAWNTNYLETEGLRTVWKSILRGSDFRHLGLLHTTRNSTNFGGFGIKFFTVSGFRVIFYLFTLVAKRCKNTKPKKLFRKCVVCNGSYCNSNCIYNLTKRVAGFARLDESKKK